MFKIFFLILVLMSSVVFAQDTKTAKPEAQKIDEFPALADCARGARIDGWLVELQNRPKAKGYIIFYQAEDALPSDIENPRFADRLYLNYITFRGFDTKRIVIINSYRKEMATELWIVPENAKPPVPTDTVPKPKISLAKTFLYDRGWFTFEYSDFLNEFLLPEKKAELEREREEIEKEFQTDKTSVENIEIEKLSVEEIEAEKFEWLSERFGEFLKENKKMKGVIIFYADDLEYSTGKLWNLVEEGKQKISEQSKISPDKIQLLFGGYRDSIQMEFWVMPENGEFPTPKPDTRIIEEETEEQ